MGRKSTPRKYRDNRALLDRLGGSRPLKDDFKKVLLLGPHSVLSSLWVDGCLRTECKALVEVINFVEIVGVYAGNGDDAKALALEARSGLLACRDRAGEGIMRLTAEELSPLQETVGLFEHLIEELSTDQYNGFCHLVNTSVSEGHFITRNHAS